MDRDPRPCTLRRWSDPAEPVPGGLAGLLAAYHLATEAEKGAPVADVAALPARYRAEVFDPRSAFAGGVVLVATAAGRALGCAVVAGDELKRLWVDPAARGHGVAAALVRAALAEGAIRLSVWRWRADAVALYERLGFAVVPSWDPRADLVCMAHTG